MDDVSEVFRWNLCKLKCIFFFCKHRTKENQKHNLPRLQNVRSFDLEINRVNFDGTAEFDTNLGNLISIFYRYSVDFLSSINGQHVLELFSIGS